MRDRQTFLAIWSEPPWECRSGHDRSQTTRGVIQQASDAGSERICRVEKFVRSPVNARNKCPHRPVRGRDDFAPDDARIIFRKYMLV